jgi:putative ABC transport system permease protein
VIVINDTMARQMFPGENPVGQRLQLYGRAREIVGVIGSVRHHGFNREPRPEMILPNLQFQFGGMTLVVRSALEPSALGRAVAREVHTLDPQLPLSRVRTLDEYLSNSVAQPRFTSLLLISFALVAMLLALVGVYGVMSYAVSQRRREIGVRIALGADRSDVVRMVVGHGMILAAIGIVAGLVTAAAGTQLIEGLLFGVTPTDPFTFAFAAAAMAVASFSAAFLPAWRAARVAPATALRTE